MEEECVIVDETSGTTPPQKKMKQSRLPFTPLQGKSPKTVSKQLKRKLSNSDLVCKSPKTPRSESESTPKNRNEVEAELPDTKDTKEKENTKDDEMETSDHEKTKAEKKEEVKENVKKRGRSSGSKNNTPAKSTPSRNHTPAKSTPTRNRTPAKSTPTRNHTPAKSTPRNKTPANSTPTRNKTAKSTPSKETEKEKKNTEKGNEVLIDDQVNKAKKRGRPSGSGKTPSKVTPSETKKAEQHDESGKQEGKLKKNNTPSKGKDVISKKAKTPGKIAKKFDKSGKKDLGKEIVNDDKVGEKLQPMPDISDDEDSAQINESKSESDSMEEKSNIEKLDDKVQVSKDESKKRKATDEKSNATSKTAAEDSQNETKLESEKDKSVKKKTRNSLDAFVKKGAEAMALKENAAKIKNEVIKGKATNGDIKEESEMIKTPPATNKSKNSNESESPESGDSTGSESENTKTPDSKTSFKSPQAVKPIKLTPGQLAKEAERLKKKEEREKEKEEKLKKKQQEIEDKKKLKEEEKKLKEEEKKKKDEEREKEKKQKEEERLQKLEEKEQQKKELEKEKEEKKRIKQEAIEAKLKEKEEKRLKKEEEKRLQEEEECRQKEQAKAKFSSFFVAKKVISTSVPEEKKNEYFCQFQLKNNMRLAPVIRHQLANESKESLDEYISGNRKESEENLFINSIKIPGYTIGTSVRTFPPQEQKEEENDCEVIEEEDNDGIGEEVVTSESVPKGKTTVRRKVLKFCENNRPPYRGTWRKTTKQISARRPFRKDEDMFNYEYDSDDDWEEEANGESLSDCEDEKDEEEEGKTEAENDYEVDNDFFVPHGYLSDDEGKSDQEEEENEMEVDEKDTNKKKEQLKQKQTDFENEIKQKTRQLKPRVFGCLWLSEEDTNKAFDQLLKVLNPHRAVVCCSSKLPIATSYSKGKPKDMNKEVNDSTQDGDETAGASQGDQKYVKNFPEEAVPALIKLLHCNRNSKIFLGKEFCEYWKKNSEEGVEDSMASRHGLLAKAKIDAKISELGAIWGKNAEEGAKAKYLMWTLPLEVREKYGLSELSSTNTWTYILKPKERNTQECSEEPSVDPKTPKNSNKDSKTPKITAFAKKCSPGSSNNLSKTPSGIPVPGSTSGATPKTPRTPLEASSAKTPRTTSEGSSTPGTQKKLFSKAPQEVSAANAPSKTPKSSIANFFKKKVDKECPKDGEDKVKQGEKIEKCEESGTKDDAITLD